MAEEKKGLHRPLHHKLSVVAIIGFLILGGFTVWSAFFKETKKQIFHIEPGSSPKFDLREERKKLFIPSVSGGIRQWSDSGIETFIEAKITVEF